MATTQKNPPRRRVSRHAPPIRDLEECEFSAQFWADQLPGWATKMKQRGENYTLASTMLTTATGLGVWATIQTDTRWWAQAAVSFVALAAAFMTFKVKQRDYSAVAGDAFKLADDYGDVLTDLRQAIDGNEDACVAIKKFEDIRHRKFEKLAPSYPRNLQDQRVVEWKALMKAQQEQH